MGEEDETEEEKQRGEGTPEIRTERRNTERHGQHSRWQGRGGEGEERGLSAERFEESSMRAGAIYMYSPDVV